MARSVVPLPVDPALPLAAGLVDSNGLAALVAPWFGPRIDGVRVRYLEYRPGSWLRVQLAVDTPDGAGAAVVQQEAGAAVSVWRYPDDPGLPALAAHAGGGADLLAWVPGRRAVLRTGEQVIKFHDDAASLRQAVLALELVGTVLPAPAVLEVREAERAYVQGAVAGRALARADAAAVAPAAAALVRALHDAALAGLDAWPRLAAVEVLEQCAPVAELVGTVRPDLAPRLVAVLDALRSSAPFHADGALVASHGDYNIGQLLAGADGLVVVDTDTLCRAPRAFDPASYAANVVSGRDGDLEAALELLGLLREGYGEVDGVPLDDGELRWFLAAVVLRRADRAVRRFKKDWPERTGRTVAAVEALLGGA